jgi:hypothetical protein
VRSLRVTELVRAPIECWLNRHAPLSNGAYLLVCGLPEDTAGGEVARLFADFAMLPPSLHRCVCLVWSSTLWQVLFGTRSTVVTRCVLAMS